MKIKNPVTLPIPSGYVKPEGQLVIKSNGIYPVRNYETVKAELTPVLVSIPIDSNRWTSDTSLYPYNQKAVVSVNLGDLTTNSTIRLINDNESEGIFAKYGFFASNANDTSITIFAIDKPLVDVILKAEIIYGEGESGTPTIINPVSIVRKDKLADICSKTVQEILLSDLEGATQILPYLCENCIYLEYVELPNSITKIGNYSFNGCISLRKIKFLDADKITTIGNNAFYNCSILESIIIGNSVTSILQQSFEGCTSLTSVTIGDSVTSIARQSFSRCASLTSVTIPKSVKSIGTSGFQYCGIKSVNYTGDINSWAQISFGSASANPLYNVAKLYINGEEVTSANIDTATTISAYAFNNCSSLTSVTIGSGITQIQASVFQGCTALKEIIINKHCETIDDVPTLGSTSAIPTTCIVKVPDELTKSLYEQKTNWNVCTIVVKE